MIRLHGTAFTWARLLQREWDDLDFGHIGANMLHFVCMRQIKHSNGTLCNSQGTVFHDFHLVIFTFVLYSISNYFQMFLVALYQCIISFIKVAWDISISIHGIRNNNNDNNDNNNNNNNNNNNKNNNNNNINDNNNNNDTDNDTDNDNNDDNNNDNDGNDIIIMIIIITITITITIIIIDSKYPCHTSWPLPPVSPSKSYTSNAASICKAWTFKVHINTDVYMV